MRDIAARASTRVGWPIMASQIILASVALGAVALAMNVLGAVKTPTYRTFRPEGAGPHPAVVFAAGCSGFAPPLAPKAYERAAERLRGQGYVVIFADYLGRRGLKSCVSGRVSRSEAGKDIVAAA